MAKNPCLLNDCGNNRDKPRKAAYPNQVHRSKPRKAGVAKRDRRSCFLIYRRPPIHNNQQAGNRQRLNDKTAPSFVAGVSDHLPAKELKYRNGTRVAEIGRSRKAKTRNSFIIIFIYTFIAVCACFVCV